MKRSLPLLIFLIGIIPSLAEAEKNIGRITEITGVIKKTNINCEKGACGNRWDEIYPGESIMPATTLIRCCGTDLLLVFLYKTYSTTILKSRGFHNAPS